MLLCQIQCDSKLNSHRRQKATVVHDFGVISIVTNQRASSAYDCQYRLIFSPFIWRIQSFPYLCWFCLQWFSVQVSNIEVHILRWVFVIVIAAAIYINIFAQNDSNSNRKQNTISVFIVARIQSMKLNYTYKEAGW